MTKRRCSVEVGMFRGECQECFGDLKRSRSPPTQTGGQATLAGVTRESPASLVGG
jgi:hypothetical protein